MISRTIPARAAALVALALAPAACARAGAREVRAAATDPVDPRSPGAPVPEGERASVDVGDATKSLDLEGDAREIGEGRAKRASDAKEDARSGATPIEAQRQRTEDRVHAEERLTQLDARARELEQHAHRSDVGADRRAAFDDAWRRYTAHREVARACFDDLDRAPGATWDDAKRALDESLDALSASVDALHPPP